MSDGLAERVSRLSAEIGARAAALSDSLMRDLVFAEARRELIEHFTAQSYPADEAARLAERVIDAARGRVSDLTATVRLGQLWEVYSVGADRWVAGTVTDIDGDYVTLRAQGQQWQRCHVDDMRDGHNYRLLSDLRAVR
ncbi:MAG TPA: hypothetical protein VMC10_18095 [Stellaceae bacterium]|nr:hypothetical protein [Stellaceae bacterium]